MLTRSQCHIVRCVTVVTSGSGLLPACLYRLGDAIDAGSQAGEDLGGGLIGGSQCKRPQVASVVESTIATHRPLLNSECVLGHINKAANCHLAGSQVDGADGVAIAAHGVRLKQVPTGRNRFADGIDARRQTAKEGGGKTIDRGQVEVIVTGNGAGKGEGSIAAYRELVDDDGIVLDSIIGTIF